ncbi:MAG: prepilin-type N-terminal cleavage/methylation domain-containing protein [Planctomycetota bacterium]|nr:prepilin-type N-terminal cleavage/methylation domain-containing protein [Planctomycetota bacterium]
MGSKYKNPNGFTLAEAMIATVILGIAAAGILLPFTSGQVVRAEGVHRTLGAKLAADLMEKIVNTPFNQIVASYNYSEAKGQVKDSAGVVFTDLNYANYSRDVSCHEVYVPQESGTGQSKFILATVKVYYSGKQIVIINRLITK